MARGWKNFNSHSTGRELPEPNDNTIDENCVSSDSIPSELLAQSLPRVLIVSRRTVRKSKFVDFVGEYHLDLIVRYGAVPVIVPRVPGLHDYLDSFEPIHGVLLCEGEDIDPAISGADTADLSPDEVEEIRAMHSSDSAIDKAKDSLELQLAKRCLERNIPYLGICRGSQVLNVASGGTLYQDVEVELSRKVGIYVKHMDYSNYDGHRHTIEVVKETPLEEWFFNSLQMSGGEELHVNSYHHQGVRKLAPRFKPMAHAPDGLVEAFYDPDNYDPMNGKFIVGLQFHPERMRHLQDADATKGPEPNSIDLFDYPECPRAYQEFARAVIAFKEKAQLQMLTPNTMNKNLEKQRREIVKSFDVARRVYEREVQMRKNSSEHGGDFALRALTMERSRSHQDLRLGADFLEEATHITLGQTRRLKQMGATVRNSSLVLDVMENKTRQASTSRAALAELDNSQLQEAVNFHSRMAEAAIQLLHNRGADVTL